MSHGRQLTICRVLTELYPRSFREKTGEDLASSELYPDASAHGIKPVATGRTTRIESA